jgi:tetratricopeptide (TPR) repeat protein
MEQLISISIHFDLGMSHQNLTIQGNGSSQNLPPTFPSVGWSVPLLLLGGLVGWQLALRHSRKMSSGSATIPETASNDRSQDPAQLNFSQALQWVAYAQPFQKSKRYDEAVAIYDRGLIKHPNDFRLWHERGLTLALLERFEEAIESYDRAYEIKPTHKELAHERGDALLELGRYEAAIASFEVYLRFEPKSIHILSDWGYALYKLNRFEEALQLLNSVLNAYGKDPNSKERAHYYQIASLQSLGELEAALQSSQAAMRLYSQEHFEAQNEALKQELFEAVEWHQAN